MIKFENTEVVGWEHAIRGMRNPLESWEKSDSGYFKRFDGLIHPKPKDGSILVDDDEHYPYFLGPNDLDLMKRLRNAGTDHRKFMRMIVVYVDITAPLYWWKEFDTYKVGTVANSCSTMHCIHKKEFTLEDFSYEHLIDDDNPLLQNLWETFEDKEIRGYLNSAVDDLSYTIDKLNAYREMYLRTKDKAWWRQIIQTLPINYNQKRTVMMNYEVLANIYKSCKNHKLDEWKEHENNVIGFCDWIKTLPHSKLITG